mgnify:CR=1 FL=1
MKDKLIMIGSVIFIIGIVVEVLYSLFPLFVPETGFVEGIKTGIALLVAGGAMILIGISIDRFKEYKIFKKEINKKDLIP